MNLNDLWVVLAALVSAGPAYLALRVRGTTRDEGTATREALTQAVGTINDRMNELRDDVREVRDWQTAHAAAHTVLGSLTRVSTNGNGPH